MKRFPNDWCCAVVIWITLAPATLRAEGGEAWRVISPEDGPTVLRQIANMQAEHRERIRCWNCTAQLLDETVFRVSGPQPLSQTDVVDDGREFKLSYRGDVRAIVDFISNRVRTQISIPNGLAVLDPTLGAPFTLPAHPWSQFTVFCENSCRTYFPNQPPGVDKTGSSERYVALPTDLQQLTYRRHWFEIAFMSLDRLLDPRQCFGGNGIATAYIRLAGETWRNQILSNSPGGDSFALEVRDTDDGREYRFSVIDRDTPNSPMPRRRSTWIAAEAAGYQLIRCQTVRLQDDVELFAAHIQYVRHSGLPLPDRFEIRAQQPSLYGYTFRRCASFASHERRDAVPKETFSLAKYDLDGRAQNDPSANASINSRRTAADRQQLMDPALLDKAGFRQRVENGQRKSATDPGFMAIGPPLFGRMLPVIGGIVCAFVVRLLRLHVPRDVVD